MKRDYSQYAWSDFFYSIEKEHDVYRAITINVYRGFYTMENFFYMIEIFRLPQSSEIAQRQEKFLSRISLMVNGLRERYAGFKPIRC